MTAASQQIDRPQRHPQNPLLRPDDRTWEGGCQVYGTACYDETAQRFKMWYLAGLCDRGLKPLVVNGIERAPHTTLVAYAESKDGIQWTKPDLGQGTIVDGHYRIDGRGSIPVGRHRVEIVAEHKTGRKIPNVAMVGSMTDELERISADEFAGEQSPLIKEITRQSDGRLDLEIPPRS